MNVTSFKRHLFSGAVMLAGAFAVFLVVFVMNAQKLPPKEEKVQKEVAFQVKKKTPPKKKKKRERRQKPKPKRSSSKAPKTPNLSSAISEAAFELPGFDAAALGAASSDLIGDFSKNSPMTEGAVDTKPVLRGKGGRLEYPEQARKRGIEGYVLLNVLVREDGSIGRLKVLDSKPRGIFEKDAQDWVNNWVFDPATYENNPVTTWVKQKVVFRLQKS